MKRILLVLSSVGILLTGNLTAAGSKAQIPYYMYNASNVFRVDLALLFALCKVESNCKDDAINHDDGTQRQKQAGIINKSYGLFQIKLGTARQLGFKAKVKDLLKPDVNAWYAAKLLRELYDSYGSTSNVISAYNAGKPVRSNRDYVNRVLSYYADYKIDKRY